MPVFTNGNDIWMCLHATLQSVGLKLARYKAAGIYYGPMDKAIRAVPDSATTPETDGQETVLRALLVRLRRRDETALAEFYDATAARVYALAKRIVRQAGIAEEVVSDVYLQIWQQAERYDAARGRVLTWTLTICRSRALDRLRRHDETETHPEPYHLRPDLDRHDDDPLALLLAVERNSRVYAALATLDATQQRLLALAFLRGLTHQEIAAHTHMPLGSVKTVLRRALETLRTQLGGTMLAPEKFS